MIEFNMVKLHKIKSLKAITGAIKKIIIIIIGMKFVKS